MNEGVIPYHDAALMEVSWETMGDAVMKIEHYPWDVNGYTPEAECRILCCTDGFKVNLFAAESVIKATYTEMNDPVYKDSCLELFLAPAPHASEHYFNFELNPLGTLLLSYGKDRFERERIGQDDFKRYFQIKPEIHEHGGQVLGWSVEFVIPHSFIRRYIPAFKPEPRAVMKGNFYKCGDETQTPHYGCWNHIDLPKPNFHVPAFFGKLIIGEPCSS